MYWLSAIAAVLSLSGLAAAQGRPAGIPAGNNPLCISPDNPSSPYYQSGLSAQTAPSAPIVRWADRWGAIDNRDGGAGLGVAQMSSSERKAKRVAMDECLAKGGQRCKVILTYRNQCGVVVAGDAGGNSMSAESIDKASELGIERCEKDGLKGCRVYYSNCSFAERVR
jgi:hypothetical protein